MTGPSVYAMAHPSIEVDPAVGTLDGVEIDLDAVSLMYVFETLRAASNRPWDTFEDAKKGSARGKVTSGTDRAAGLAPTRALKGNGHCQPRRQAKARPRVRRKLAVAWPALWTE